MAMQHPGAPAPEQGGGEQSAPGGASQMAADLGTGLMKFADMVNSKFPEEGQALQGLAAQFQDIVGSLGQAPGAEKQGPPMPGTTSPEAGAAKTQQAL